MEVIYSLPTRVDKKPRILVRFKMEGNSPRTPRKEKVTMEKKNPNLSILPNWQQRLQPSYLIDTTPSWMFCLFCF